MRVTYVGLHLSIRRNLIVHKFRSVITIRYLITNIYMIRVKYDLNRHLALLKREQHFKQQGKSFFLESSDEYFESIKYSAVIEEEIYWKGRILVLLLMGEFINKTISGEEFSDSFFQLSQMFIDDCNNFLNDLLLEKVEDFQPDPRSQGFGSLISFLKAECDNFTEDYDSKEFYDSIHDCFLKLQEVLNEE